MAYFFCGIGGSGMLPLALIAQAQGASITGSDRSRDQGKTSEKFSFLERHGIKLFPQDGSGITADIEALVVSAAVEETIPDVQAARRLGVPIITRAQLLARYVNKALEKIVVAGTSGKTTTTGMIGFILHEGAENPTVMNGGIFRNYSKDNPYCSALMGRPELFVTEADESDGSIALYQPSIAVLNNVSLDHKSMDELLQLFGDFLAKSPAAVINLDDPLCFQLVRRCLGRVMSYGIDNPAARLQAQEIILTPEGSQCFITDMAVKETWPLILNVPGKHNIMNALAALAVMRTLDLDLAKPCEILGRFEGIKRRMERVGQNKGIVIYDDFAHNPDKISASLEALKAGGGQGRLLVMFQPHGFGPLRLMRRELVEAFASHLSVHDKLYMPEPYYAGGTVDRSVSSQHIVADLKEKGIAAAVLPDRASILPLLQQEAKAGDRIIIMGARDDTLSDFALTSLQSL